ncbi:hypothetical protein PMAYCL1PPCAC_01294, partial [Pristionchus mayeri]
QTKVRTVQIRFDKVTKTLTCANVDKDLKSLRKIEINGKFYDSLKCENYRYSHTWRSGAEKVVEGSEQISAPCVDLCAVAEGDGISKVKKGDTVEVTCDRELYLFYADNPVTRSKATYNPYDGWSGSSLIKADDFKTTMSFECREPPVDSCKFDNAAGEFNFEKDTRTLTCTEKYGKLLALSVNSIRYTS